MPVALAQIGAGIHVHHLETEICRRLVAQAAQQGVRFLAQVAVPARVQRELRGGYSGGAWTPCTRRGAKLRCSTNTAASARSIPIRSAMKSNMLEMRSVTKAW